MRRHPRRALSFKCDGGLGSVMEQSQSGEGHHHTVLVAGGDNLIITQAVSGLEDESDAVAVAICHLHKRDGIKSA